jgi:hypothetical protein
MSKDVFCISEPGVKITTRNNSVNFFRIVCKDSVTITAVQCDFINDEGICSNDNMRCDMLGMKE